MKKKIKDNDNCARQAYVPASVKVIKVTTMRRILNDSGGPTESGNAFDHIQ